MVLAVPFMYLSSFDSNPNVTSSVCSVLVYVLPVLGSRAVGFGTDSVILDPTLLFVVTNCKVSGSKFVVSGSDPVVTGSKPVVLDTALPLLVSYVIYDVDYVNLYWIDTIQ